MALSKEKDFRKIRCRYGLRDPKLYTFLCNDDLADSLSAGDFVVVDSKEEFAIVQVVDETDTLFNDIIYKHILRKL